MEADRTPEHAGIAGVMYSVLTSRRSDSVGCLDKLRLRKAIEMLVAEAGVHIRSERMRDYCIHWRMREGLLVILGLAAVPLDTLA